MSSIALPQERRLERARVRRRLKEGEMSLRAALDHPAMQTMLIFDLLLALPAKRGPRFKMGSKEIRKCTILADSLLAHLPHRRGPLTRVKDLTGRETDVLVYAYARYMEPQR